MGAKNWNLVCLPTTQPNPCLHTALPMLHSKFANNCDRGCFGYFPGNTVICNVTPHTNTHQYNLLVQIQQQV